MSTYRINWTRILRIFAPSILFMIIAVIIYPKEIDVINVDTSVRVTDEKISIVIDSESPFDRFYDYQIEYEQQNATIFVRWSPFFGKDGPQILEIPNRFPEINVIVLRGKNKKQVIFER